MPRNVTFLALSLSLITPALAQEDTRVMLRYATFDPLEAVAPVPGPLAAGTANRLFLVQYVSVPTDADRAALLRAGAEITWYAPHNGYIVRTSAMGRQQIEKQARVRWVGAFHPAYKFDPALLANLQAGVLEPARYDIVMVDPKRDEAALVGAVGMLGGSMWRYSNGNLLIEADLTPPQVLALSRENTVLWIQAQTAATDDMDNARIQGGANYIQQLGGYTGKGVRGHICEGIYPTHTEFAANTYRTVPLQVFSGAGTSHGNSTFGEVFSRGALPAARGMCPDGQGYFTDYAYIMNSAVMTTAQNTRYGVVRAITDPTLQWKVMFQTASWGYAQITAYDARSAEMDWIIHQFDIATCQSQSNTSNQQSRPQAWAKNIISVGALNHLNTSSANDDTQSGTSMGPANDGRIKPDVCAYYDGIHTTNTATTYTTGFGGTSGATPMVAGHVGLIYELFTDGLFGHPAATSWQTRFDVKPHFSTVKALLINTARQYDPAVNGSGATSRYRQGWGFPALHDLYDLRNNMLVLDEQDTLQQGGMRSYVVLVKPQTPLFRATMVYADLAAATPFTAPHRVNNLDLRVISPTGAIYHGNNGMATLPISRFTPPGGSPNTLDTVENVFVQNPQFGLWRIEVSAPLVVIDQHVETPAVDADFALVCSGIGAGRDTSGPVLDLSSSGPGDLQLSITNLPANYSECYVFFSLSTAQGKAMGNFLGLEADALSMVSVNTPAAQGEALHFLPTANPAQYPNVPHVFPFWVPTLLQGFTLDAVALFVDANGGYHAASNVDRITL